MKVIRLRTMCLLPATIILLLAGCSTYSSDNLRVSPRSLGNDIPTIGSQAHPISDDTQIAEQTADGEVTLKMALALALMRNSELRAFSWEVRAAEAEMLQAGLRPNPEVEIEVEEFDSEGTGFESAETTIALSQLVELGGKRRKRRAVAELSMELAGWEYEAKRLDVFSKTTHVFVDVLAAQRSVELATEAVELASKVHTVVGERVKSGKVTPLESNRSSVELAMSRIGLERSRKELESARSRLGAMWGDTKPAFTLATGLFDAVLQTIPSIEVIEKELLSNPEIARWGDEIKLRKARVSLEWSESIPNLSASAGVQQFEATGEDALTFGLAVDLPLFDRNQGGIQAAKHQLSKAKEEQRSTLVEVRSEMTEAYKELSASHSEAMALQNDILPAAEQAFKAAQGGYKQGKFGYLEVLDAQRTLFEVTEKRVESLASYHKAVADLERLIGRSLETMNTDRADRRHK